MEAVGDLEQQSRGRAREEKAARLRQALKRKSCPNFLSFACVSK